MKFTKYLLKDVANVDISGVDKKSKPGETQVRLCNFVDVYYNWAVTKSMTDNFMVATANNNQIEKFTIKKGQVAITKDSETRDDIGVSTYIADDFDELVILGYHNALITPDESKLDGKYLNAYLHTKMAQNYFSYNASGSGQRYALSVDAINDFQIYLPPIEEQRRVGNLLSDIDRKIALNKSINCDLEAMAKQLYDYWFVQFDFPNAEGKPYKSSGGKMVWNETLKREIPEGWSADTLGNIVEINRGTTITEKTSTPGNIKVVAAGLDFSYYHNVSNREENCITISGSGENAGFVRFWREPIFASDCSTIRCDSLTDTLLIYHTLKSHQNHFYRISHRSAQPHIQPSDVATIPMIVVPKEVKDKISILFEKTNSKIKNNISELEDLIKLRDTLLPLLMNGQVSIKQQTNRN